MPNDRNKYEDRILAAACSQFSALGYYGSRVDAIAVAANLNKRMVYEYSHTKEGLYLAVLSNISNKFLTILQEALPDNKSYSEPVEIFQKALDVLEYYEDFTRLWAWEVMAPTIHGPRIIETSHAMFERIKKILAKNVKGNKACAISDETFELLESMIHGHMLTCALYTQDSGNTEEGVSPSALDIKRKSLVRCNREMLLSAISQHLK